jgi:two-component system nitrogen regulation response regulator GlnG
VDDDRSIRWVLERAFSQAGMDVQSFEDAGGVLEALRAAQPDAIITDIRMAGIDGIELLQRIHSVYPRLPVIVMTAHSDLDSAVAAYQGGAFEYLPKPFDLDEAVELVRKAAGHYRLAHPMERPPEGRGRVPEIIGQAASMQEVFRAIGRLSRSHVSVLIIGETGTGKELVARALHRHSPRASGPFIALNMAAIPRDLLESELFGHEKGAFTGASGLRYGRFEQADGGTLLLDEIGDMPPELQTRLLRVLADGQFYRVGGHIPIKVDVRILAATHQDLDHLLSTKRFREDLFHRLNVIRIRIPPLRERRADVPHLAREFLAQTARELNVPVKLLHPEVEVFLMSLDWPGNVRQLENLCRWLTVMASAQEVHLADLPPELTRDSITTANAGPDWSKALTAWADQRLRGGDVVLLDEALPEFERILIRASLQHTAGRRQDAARLLGWGRNTLTRKIKELGMET